MQHKYNFWMYSENESIIHLANRWKTKKIVYDIVFWPMQACALPAHYAHMVAWTKILSDTCFYF